MTSKCKGQLHFNYTKLESRESSHNTTLKVYYYSNKDKMKEENTITQLEAIQEKKKPAVYAHNRRCEKL